MIIDWYRFGFFCLCLFGSFFASGIHGIIWFMAGITYVNICES